MACKSDALPEFNMRVFLFLPWVLLMPLRAMAAEPSPGRSIAAPSCESRDLTFESKEIVCTIHASTHEQRLRLLVNFAGGHDDTIAAMAVQLNGEPFACGADSKLRLMGEDGEVSLNCALSIAAGVRRDVVLRSVVSWTHAQYTGYTLD